MILVLVDTGLRASELVVKAVEEAGGTALTSKFSI
jgi:hypothetical protein